MPGNAGGLYRRCPSRGVRQHGLVRYARDAERNEPAAETAGVTGEFSDAQFVA
jgi:hypothetical protein